MNPIGSRVACLLTCAVAVLTVATPGRAQFDEPDTIPRLGIGPIVELTFRGARGEAAAGEVDVGLSNGPAFGGLLEFRFSRTGALALMGTYGRTQEEQRTGGGQTVLGREMSIVQGIAEIMFKIRENVPGFFVIGAGARRVTPRVDGQAGFHRTDPFTEPLGVLGAGLNFGLSRRDQLRAAARWYVSVPAEQPGREGENPGFDTNGLLSDIALGFAYLRRF